MIFRIFLILFTYFTIWLIFDFTNWKNSTYKCQDHSIYKKHGNEWIKIKENC